MDKEGKQKGVKEEKTTGSRSLHKVYPLKYFTREVPNPSSRMQLYAPGCKSVCTPDSRRPRRNIEREKGLKEEEERNKREGEGRDDHIEDTQNLSA